MKRKWIAPVLGLVVLVVLGGTYLSLKNYNTQQEQESETEESAISIAAIPEDEIMAFSYQHEKETLSFEKENGLWYYTTDKKFPLDQEKVNTLTGNFASLRAVRDLGEQDNLEDFGLKNPSNEISVEQTSGTEDIFYLGDENSTTGYHYLYMNNAANIYTVDSTLKEAFSGGLYSLAKMENLPSVTASNITKVTVTKENKNMSLASARDDSAVWKVSASDGTLREADSTKITQLLSNLTNLYYKEFVDYQCNDLSKYGLKKPVARMEMEYTQTKEESVDAQTDSQQQGTSENTSETQDIKTVTETKSLTILVGSQNEEGDYYVKLMDSNQVYTMAEDSLKPWLEAEAGDLAEAVQQTKKEP